MADWESFQRGEERKRGPWKEGAIHLERGERKREREGGERKEEGREGKGEDGKESLLVVGAVVRRIRVLRDL